MADGLCTGDPVGNVIEKTIVKDYDNVMECETNDSVNDVACEKVNTFYMASESDKLFDKLCVNNTDGEKHEGFLPCEDDCRKKRCVDRYDSSESSDSGVAVLSCTDCSGSSTASSDITDPGSPFSTASSHSEDSGSGSQPAKMPPTQTAHHPPWPWTAEEGPTLKRVLHEKTAFPKRLKSAVEEPMKQSPPCLLTSQTPITKSLKAKESTADPSPKSIKSKKEKIDSPKFQQGKITEYFKSQCKSNGLKKELSNLLKPNDLKHAKFAPLVEQHNQINGLKAQTFRKDIRTIPATKKTNEKTRKPVSVPRKILPAPSKISEKITINNHHHVNGLTNFAPTVTLTAVSFPPNLTYLHTKAPKPPDNIFVPQFATIANDKINAIPIINRTPCLNVIQPVQKITTINNFNCVKLNATVVPIVKLNTLPSRLNASPNLASVALSVETAVPTVLSAKPKLLNETSINSAIPINNSPVNNLQTTPKQHGTPNSTFVSNVQQNQCKSDEKTRTEEPYRTEECQTQDSMCQTQTDVSRTQHEISRSEKSPTPDSDSGISNKECLEVCVSEPVLVEQQKSPILSQPKTIRFPAKEQKEDIKDSKPSHSSDGLCRWAECNAQFNTSGALLEHLQVKHVISQATQEQYVCLWLGCKVHGRTSCSRSWLERHVLAHAGTKPFRCIVDGCGQRFNSQLMLERHVNNHFNSDGNQNGTAKKSTENSSMKLFKRNGKRIRFRRQPWSARMFDFIDGGIMEGIQYKLLQMTQKRTLGQISNAGDTVNLQSRVLAKRIETDGTAKFLVTWQPPDIIPDEWVTEKEYTATKTIPIPALHPSSKDALKPSLFPPKSDAVRQKHRRKPISKQT